MARTLIIGYGNPLRGDDGLGWHAAGQLRMMKLKDADVLTLHQLTPELAEDASRAELVIFLDASETGTPGEWRNETVLPEAGPQAFTHHASPAGILSNAGALFGNTPKGLLFTMTGESFDYREGLSATVAARLPEMLAAVVRAVS